MSIADQTDLAVTLELLRAGLLDQPQDLPGYPDEVLKKAVSIVAEKLTRHPLPPREPRS